MDTNNNKWDNMQKIAEAQQQEYYELLPEWTLYSIDEYKYLKQNIGFSLFGPPTESEDSTLTESKNKKQILYSENVTGDYSNIIHTLCYTREAQQRIDTIFDKICTFGKTDSNRICYGIIFNVTLPIKKSSLKESEITVQPIPIFKISRKKDKYKKIKTVDENKIKPFDLYETWYIDIHGRIYKSWEDYKTCNTLPKCTMVLPMNGLYQPDKTCKITEEYSKVWLEIVNSPACTVVKKVLEGMDIAATVAGFAGIGVGIASVMIPVAPVLLGAAVVSGIGTGTWNIGRSAYDLVDRSKHEESISLKNRNAMCSWLSLTSSTIGLAATGGSALLVKAVHKGSNINTVAKYAFNTLIFGNLSMNGAGIAFQGYSMYVTYQEKKVVRIVDVLNLVTHVLFFGNAVINTQLAGRLIESTQGKILDDYRSSLRTKRLRKSFNRVKRTAAANNTEKFNENVEVIRYINRKTDMSLKQSGISTNNVVSFDSGKVTLYGRVLLDPMKFVFMLLQEDQSKRKDYTSMNPSNMEVVLKDLLSALLTSYNSNNNEDFILDFNIYEFDQIIYDMKHMETASEILVLLFKLGVILIKESNSLSTVLAKAIYFLWRYIVVNLKQYCFNATSSIEDPNIQEILNRFIIYIFEHSDTVVTSLAPAFTSYVLKSTG